MIKRNRILNLTKVLFLVFGIGTIISLIIVYMDSDSQIAYKFVLAYVFLAFFMILYIPMITIINSRKVKWKEIRKRLFIFIILLLLFVPISYGLDYIQNPLEAKLFQKLPQNIGITFSIAFFDIVFLKDKKEK